MNYQAMKDMLMNDEGVRFHLYEDTRGKQTIGVGRNLTDVGISKDEAMVLLDNDITAAVNALDQVHPWWRSLSEIRQHVLVNMCFNIGIAGLGGFKKALTAMQAGDYETAANEMQDSTWYVQVGARAIRLVSLMRQGQ